MTSHLTFEDLGLSSDILAALTKKGFKEPTPIQQQTIPLLLSGEKDIIAQAQTGTGKTAAFGIPILERIEEGLQKVQAIIIAPTRELANQVSEELESLKAGRNIRILPVYGGQGMDTQLRQLKAGVDIVVATPGRAIDHLKRKTLRLDHIRFVVLDEADEMLQMGFIEDIEKILSFVPDKRRMLLFSATMPPRIQELAKKFMGEFDVVKVNPEQRSATLVEQIYYSVKEKDKLRALVRLIETEPEFYSLVFCRTRKGSDRLAEKLTSLGYDVEALHGDVSQVQRERILSKFKKGHASILVATDVAARGIDINDLSHVINFDLPDSKEAYVHRIGRTGRAGKAGKAISFVALKDRYRFNQLNRLHKNQIVKKTLPFGMEVVEMKKQTMLTQVFGMEEEEIPQEFYNLAQEILASGKPKSLVASLLKLHFGNQLRPNAYPEISDPDKKSFTHTPSRTGTGPKKTVHQKDRVQEKASGKKKAFVKPSKNKAGKKAFKRKKIKQFD